MIGLIEVMKTFTHGGGGGRTPRRLPRGEWRPGNGPASHSTTSRSERAMPIRTLFVANRGEIAVRIIRAAKALGIRTVQAVSAADKEMLAARLADAVADVGPAHAT